MDEHYERLGLPQTIFLEELVKRIIVREHRDFECVDVRMKQYYQKLHNHNNDMWDEFYKNKRN